MSAGGEQKSQVSSSGAKAPWHALVLTLYPGMFPGPLGAGIVGRAVQDGAFALDTIDIRDFASDKHRTVDDLPFGGGPGLVMKPDVVDAALAAAISSSRPACAGNGPRPTKTGRVQEVSSLLRNSSAAWHSAGIA